MACVMAGGGGEGNNDRVWGCNKSGIEKEGGITVGEKKLYIWSFLQSHTLTEKGGGGHYNYSAERSSFLSFHPRRDISFPNVIATVTTHLEKSPPKKERFFVEKSKPRIKSNSVITNSLGPSKTFVITVIHFNRDNSLSKLSIRNNKCSTFCCSLLMWIRYNCDRYNCTLSFR